MNENPNAPRNPIFGKKSGALRTRIAAQQMAQALMNPQPQQAGVPLQQTAPSMTPQAAVMGQPVGLMGLGATVMRPKRVY